MLQGLDSSEKILASEHVDHTHALPSERQGEWGVRARAVRNGSSPPRSLLRGASAWAPTSGLSLGEGAGCLLPLLITREEQANPFSAV